MGIGNGVATRYTLEPLAFFLLGLPVFGRVACGALSLAGLSSTYSLCRWMASCTNRGGDSIGGVVAGGGASFSHVGVLPHSCCSRALPGWSRVFSVRRVRSVRSPGLPSALYRYAHCDSYNRPKLFFVWEALGYGVSVLEKRVLRGRSFIHRQYLLCRLRGALGDVLCIVKSRDRLAVLQCSGLSLV